MLDLDRWSQKTSGVLAWSWAAVPALLVAIGLALVVALLPLSWAALLVVGGIAVLATLVHPPLGVLIIVPAIPFGSLQQVQVGVMNVGATEALVVLVLAAWLMRMIAQREIRIRWPPLALPLAILLGVLILSSLGATSLQHSAKEVVKWLEVFALYVMVANEMDGRWTRALVFVVLGTGALVALQGIYQFWFQVKMFKFFSRNSRVSVEGEVFAGDFHGTGGQYLVKLLVGGLLTGITMGIYGAWFFVNLMKWQLHNTTYAPVKGQLTDGAM